MADLTDLAREVGALPGWRWMAGMLAERWTGPCHGSHRVDDEEARLWARDPALVWPRGLPDLPDPATVGCVLALLRELTQTPGLYVRCYEPHAPDMSGTVRRRWRCTDAQGRRMQHDGHATEAEALVALWREVTRG